MIDNNLVENMFMSVSESSTADSNFVLYLHHVFVFFHAFFSGNFFGIEDNLASHT